MNPRPQTRTRKRRRRRRSPRRGGFRFFLVCLAILIFAVVYFFAGDTLFPTDDGQIAMPLDEEIIVTFLDVGQGDSILIRTAENAVLIDGGEHRARHVVTGYLNDAGITYICYVVATHPHSDHIGGLVTVLRDFEVGTLLMPDAVNETDTFLHFMDAIENHDIDVSIPAPGDVVTAGIIRLTVLAPPTGLHTSNINNHSIVLRMDYGATSFLFTGDAETASERQMLESGQNLRADVLKVGHHGSQTSTTEEFLAAVNPSIAVIQAGLNNRHGHPHAEIIERLESHGVQIFRNDLHGTIRMFTDGYQITMERGV